MITYLKTVIKDFGKSFKLNLSYLWVAMYNFIFLGIIYLIVKYTANTFLQIPPSIFDPDAMLVIMRKAVIYFVVLLIIISILYGILNSIIYSLILKKRKQNVLT